MKDLTSLHLTPATKTPLNILVSVNIPSPSHSLVPRVNEKDINIIFSIILFVSHRKQIILKCYFKAEYCKTEGLRIKIFIIFCTLHFLPTFK